MKQCIKAELWKATHNKLFLSTILIGLLLSLLNIIQCSINVQKYTDILLNLIENGWAVSHSYEGFSLFVNWIAVNQTSFGSAIMQFVWPILCAIPFGWSYCSERRSGYCNQLLTRINVQSYFIAKYAAVFFSGGLVVAVPIAFDLLLNALVCPTSVPDVTTSILPIFNNTFAAGLYYTKPWLYALIWCVVKFAWGGITATICLAFGTKIRLRAVIVLIPFAFFAMMDAVSSLFCNLSKQSQGFSPMQLSQAATASPSPGWILIAVMGSLAISSLLLGYWQVVGNELV